MQQREHVIDSASFVAALLGWYDWSARELPWRTPPGARPDPYKVWISEIMLQQTTVKAVIPYYKAFIKRWPSVTDLAAADLDEVLQMWAGLGYYSRARNLHRCAREVVASHKARFPASEKELLTLPGVGAYTAAAVAAIAFDIPATVVDGNVERVIARLFAVEEPLPAAKPQLKRLAQTLTPDLRAGDYAQAMMDLGATVCSPRSPACLVCPVGGFCDARARGIAERLPYKIAAKERPVRRGAAFFALRSDGMVLLRKREEKGLLGGMMEVPTGEWSEDGAQGGKLLDGAPFDAPWSKVSGSVQHTFTHFHLELDVYCAMVGSKTKVREAAAPERCKWVKRRDLAGEALPSVMRKVVAHALENGFERRSDAKRAPAPS